MPNFTGLAGSLAAAAAVAAELVDPGGWPPINSILLHADTTQKVRFSGFSYGGSAEAVCVATTVMEAGAIAVDPAIGKVLSRIDPGIVVKCELVDRLIADEKVEQQLTVRAGGACFKFRAGSADKYPKLWEPGPSVLEFSLTVAERHRLFTTTEHAISDEDFRYMLRGGFLHVVADKLVLAATNGLKLVVSSIPCPAHLVASEILRKGVIVHGHIWTALIKGDIIRLSSRVIQVISNGGKEARVAELIDGTFPDYARVVPAASPKFFTVARIPLIAAIERVASLADSRLAVRLSWDDGEVALSLLDYSATEVLPCSAEECGAFGVNAAFLVQVLANSFDGQTIRIDQADPDSAIRVTDPDNAGLMAVVMPLRSGLA